MNFPLQFLIMELRQYLFIGGIKTILRLCVILVVPEGYCNPDTVSLPRHGRVSSLPLQYSIQHGRLAFRWDQLRSFLAARCSGHSQVRQGKLIP